MDKRLVFFCAILLAGYSLTAPVRAADKTTITILVASVAKTPLEEIIPLFEKTHPGISIAPIYGGGSVLAGQVSSASADMILSNNQSLAPVAQNLGAQVAIFRIHEAVIVPKGSSKVKSLRDLANPGVKIGMVTANAPAGIYSRAVLKSAGAAFGADFAAKVLANVTSSKTSDGQIVELVASGVLDAAIGHPTDASDKIDVITIPSGYDIPAIEANASAAPIKTTSHASEVSQFIAFLTGKEAQAILVKHHYDINVK
jgi:molybdate transport system substrate-binding protein